MKRIPMVNEWHVWSPGDRKPKRLPRGCQWGSDAVGWRREVSLANWHRWKRRWSVFENENLEFE